MMHTMLHSTCFLCEFLINQHLQKIIGFLQLFSFVSHKCTIVGRIKYLNTVIGQILPIFDVDYLPVT